MDTDTGSGDVINIFGFKIEKKASFTSLAAFVLAIWGVGQATYYYLQGSTPELVQPDRVIVFNDACHSSKEDILNIVMPISIVNRSQKEYSSVLRDIEIRFNLGKEYVYDSEDYVTFGSARNGKIGLVGCDTDQNLIYFIESIKPVPLEIIRGGDAYVKTILFVPDIPRCIEGGEACYRQNYLSTKEGLSKLKELAKNNKILDLQVSIKYDKGKTQSKSCRIAVNSDVVNVLEKFRHFDVFCLNKIE